MPAPAHPVRACADGAIWRALYWAVDCCSFLHSCGFGRTLVGVNAFADARDFRFGICLQALNALSLLLAIHVVALRQDVEVHACRVELRPVDAGELALVIDQHATAAAHSRAID